MEPAEFGETKRVQSAEMANVLREKEPFKFFSVVHVFHAHTFVDRTGAFVYAPGAD